MMVMLTYAAGAAAIHVDGTLVKSCTVPARATTANTPVALGGSACNHYPGALDEVRVVARALSAQEI